METDTIFPPELFRAILIKCKFNYGMDCVTKCHFAAGHSRAGEGRRTWKVTAKRWSLSLLQTVGVGPKFNAPIQVYFCPMAHLQDSLKWCFLYLLRLWPVISVVRAEDSIGSDRGCDLRPIGPTIYWASQPGSLLLPLPTSLLLLQFPAKLSFCLQRLPWVPQMFLPAFL